MKGYHLFRSKAVTLLLAASIVTGTVTGCSSNENTEAAQEESSSTIDTSSIVETTTQEVMDEASQEETTEASESTASTESLQDSSDDTGEDWEKYVGDLDAFVHTLIYNELSSSYTVFNGVMTLPDGTNIYGLGYTDYTTYLQADDDEDLGYFPCGFIGYIGEPSIPTDDINEGLIVQDVDNDNIHYQYVYAYSPEPFLEHCVIWDEYLRYGVGDDGCITYEAEPFVKENCDLTLGALYSYDDQKYLVDPDVGNAVRVTGTSLFEDLDYDELEAEVNRILEEQDYNFSSSDVESVIYESQDAIDAYWLSMQEETFMGFDVDELLEISKELDPMECVQFTSDGMVVVDMDATPPKEPEAYVKWITGICCGAAIAASVACSILVPGTAPIAGAISAAGTEIFMEVVVQNQALENVNWGKVAVAAASAAALAWVCPTLAASATKAVINNATSTTVHLFGRDLAVKGLGKLAGYSVQTLSTSVVTGATSAAYKLLDGGTVAEAGNAFAMGAALGAVMSVVGIGLGEASESFAASHQDSNGFFKKLTDGLSAKIDKHQVHIFDEKTEAILTPKSVNEAANCAEYELEKQLAHDNEILVNRVNQLPSPKNENLKLVDDAGNDISKDEILQNGGKAYITLRDDCDDEVRKLWEEAGVNRLNVTDGQVDFEPFSVQTIDLTITPNRQVNFDNTYTALADDWSKNIDTIPDEIKQQLERDGIQDFENLNASTVENVLSECHLTIHETANDQIMLVSTQIHEHISHAGGVATAKVMEQIEEGITYFHDICQSSAVGVFGTLISEEASE